MVTRVAVRCNRLVRPLADCLPWLSADVDLCILPRNVGARKHHRSLRPNRLSLWLLNVYWRLNEKPPQAPVKRNELRKAKKQTVVNTKLRKNELLREL